jgi:diguanylate cyclase (GGDEF)-like protein
VTRRITNRRKERKPEARLIAAIAALRELASGAVSPAALDALATVVELVVAGAAAEARVATLETLARTDELTGLPNRRYLVEELERQVAGARRHRRPLAALLVDLDGFKAINDARGHAAGDALLREVAMFLRRRCRANDFVARLGGDEFIVLLTETAEREAEAIAGALADAFVRRRGPAVGLSIGVAALGRADDGACLLDAADRRMYVAKRRGRAEARPAS